MPGLVTVHVDEMTECSLMALRLQKKNNQTPCTSAFSFES